MPVNQASTINKAFEQGSESYLKAQSITQIEIGYAVVNKCRETSRAFLEY